MSKLIEDHYQRLSKNIIESGGLTFDFSKPFSYERDRTVQIINNNGSEWRANYLLTLKDDTIYLHLIKIPFPNIFVNIERAKTKFGDKIYQTNEVLVVPYNDFLEILNQNLISIKWLEEVTR